MELIKKGEEIDKKLTTIIDVIIDLRNSANQAHNIIYKKIKKHIEDYHTLLDLGNK